MSSSVQTASRRWRTSLGDLLRGQAPFIGLDTHSGISYLGWQKRDTNLEEANMRDAVVVAAVGTPVGRRNGALAGTQPAHLSAVALRGLGKSYVARYGEAFPNQGVGEEQIAVKGGLSRMQLDEFALLSHERAAAATVRGISADEICPVEIGNGTFTSDEGIRRGGTLESLADIKTPFVEDGMISAANSSRITDGS